MTTTTMVMARFVDGLKWVCVWKLSHLCRPWETQSKIDHNCRRTCKTNTRQSQLTLGLHPVIVVVSLPCLGFPMIERERLKERAKICGVCRIGVAQLTSCQSQPLPPHMTEFFAEF